MCLTNERCHRAACEENDSTQPPSQPSDQWGHRMPFFFPLLIMPFCSLHSFHHVWPNSIPDHWCLCVPWHMIVVLGMTHTLERVQESQAMKLTFHCVRKERWKIWRVQLSLTQAINSLCCAFTPDPVCSVKRHRKSGPRCLCVSESVPTPRVPVRAYYPWELCGQQVDASYEPTQMLVTISFTRNRHGIFTLGWFHKHIVARRTVKSENPVIMYALAEGKLSYCHKCHEMVRGW